MNPEITKILEEIGFHEREVRVYMALLELGSSTVLPISKKADVKRTYCYDILEDLIKKGAVTYFEFHGRRRYSAEDPATIERTLKARLARFTDALPNIRLVYNNSLDKPLVKFYEGKDAIAGLLSELSETKEYSAIVSADHLSKTLGSLLEENARKIVKNKVRARELIAYSTNIPSFTEIFNTPLQEVRMLPEGMTFETDMLIFESKLVLISYGSDVHAVVIEGSALVETQRKLFEFMWGISPGKMPNPEVSAKFL